MPETSPIQYIEKIYKENYLFLRNYLFKLTGNKEESDDIIQELFTKIITKPSMLTKVKSIRSWLKVGAKNTLIDRYKKKRPTLLKEDIIENLLISNYTPEDHTIVNSQLKSILDSLSSTDKSIILAKEYYGYDYQEISELLNIKISTIKSRVFRVRKKLMKERYIDE